MEDAGCMEVACAGDCQLDRRSADNSDSDSVLSLSDKIVIESNEKRLRRRMEELQTSMTSLREQLRVEKELWKEDLEKIRVIHKQQQDLGNSRSFNRLEQESFKSDSVVSFPNTMDYCNIGSHATMFRSPRSEILATKALKHMMEMEGYKRKLAETETMCNVELSKVKQSLQDLRNLQNIASEWGRSGNNERALVKSEKAIEEIYVSKCD